MRFLKSGIVAVLGVVPWTTVSVQAPVPAKIAREEALTATTFAQYQKQIKPQPGESRWLELPWFLDLHAARQQAAAEGKPLFVYSGGGATGIGARRSAGRAVGRAPAFWTEENTKLIQENFVPVSLSNVDQTRTDAVGKFLRDAGMKLPGAGGSQWCVTASGKVLESNNHHGLGFNLKSALQKWKALPEAERAPGAVKVGEPGEIDAQRAGLTPPAGTLILKLYFRAFMRDGNKLRYVTGKDLWHDEKGEKSEAKMDETYPNRITTPQAQPDHMWLTEAEWKSLMPAKPSQGDKFAMPTGIADRFVRRHLNPLLVYGEAEPFDRRSIRSSEFSLTVEAVSPTMVRLRLEGQAKIGKEPPPEVAAGRIASIDQWGYEPKVLGTLEYDPQKQVFTRFDIVALGDQFGRLGISDSGSRPGCQPLGISFELVKGDRQADRVPPGRASTARHYFDPAR